MMLQGTPQCFLLTPKLLPDLPFSADCTVLSIVNGPLLSRLALPFNKVQKHTLAIVAAQLALDGDVCITKPACTCRHHADGCQPVCWECRA